MSRIIRINLDLAEKPCNVLAITLLKFFIAEWNLSYQSCQLDIQVRSYLLIIYMVLCMNLAVADTEVAETLGHSKLSRPPPAWLICEARKFHYFFKLTYSNYHVIIFPDSYETRVKCDMNCLLLARVNHGVLIKHVFPDNVTL